ESSPWQIPTTTTFAAPVPSEEIPASPLPEQPSSSVEQAKETAESIKTECGEQVTVNKVFDSELANVLFTIGEEDVDIAVAEVQKVAVVDAPEGSEEEDKEDLVSIEVDADTAQGIDLDEAGEPVLPAPTVPSESEAEPEEPAMLWPPRVIDDCPCSLLHGTMPLTSGICPACASQPTPEDVAMVAETDKNIPETFNRALAGSFKEGTLRCLVDLTGTFLDRPAGMPQIARGQCRSLSVLPNRLSRSDLPRSAPRTCGLGHGFKEDEESDIEKEAVPRHPCTVHPRNRGPSVGTFP
ncbi:MAG: hypothetical protein ACKPKO_34435, partial [Candidatus Fonsibacter sp.]